MYGEGTSTMRRVYWERGDAQRTRHKQDSIPIDSDERKSRPNEGAAWVKDNRPKRVIRRRNYMVMRNDGKAEMRRAVDAPRFSRRRR